MEEKHKQRVRYDISKLQIQLFTVLAVLYYILNMVFPTDYSLDAKNPNRIYPQIVAGMMTVLCVIIFLPSIRLILRNSVLRVFMIMLAMAGVYIFFPFDPVANTMYVMRTYMAIIAMFALYVMLVKVKDDGYWMRYIYLLFAFQVLFSLFVLVSDKLGQGSELIEQFDSNAGFTLITCVPMALTLPRKRLRVYVYLGLVAACLYSGQRSAALAALVSFPFCISHLRQSIRKKDIIILLTVGMLVLVPILYEAFSNLHERNMYDIDRGDMGSGRFIFWAIVIQEFFKHGLFNILLGNGTNSVVSVLERYYGLAIGAHNGWLDILYTFGFVGFLVYGMTMLMMLLRNRKSNHILPQYRNIYLVLAIVFFVKATTSHGYYDINVMPFLTVVAMLEALMDKKTKRLKNYEETCDNKQ